RCARTRKCSGPTWAHDALRPHLRSPGRARAAPALRVAAERDRRVAALAPEGLRREAGPRDGAAPEPGRRDRLATLPLAPRLALARDLPAQEGQGGMMRTLVGA